MESQLMFFIPAIVMLTPLCITILVLRYRRARAEMRYQFLLKIIESGGAIPAQIPGEVAPQYSDLRRALVLLAGGIGLSLTLMMLPVNYHVGRSLSELWGLGIFPISLGIGYLAHWWFTQRGSVHGRA
jgi:hypothetical protein